MRKVLVTGAEGFIGSHLVEALLNVGHSVRGMVQYNSFDARGWLDGISHSDFEVVMGDIRDTESVRSAVKGCDTVMHLAALIAIPYSFRAPQSYIDTNVSGTLNVLSAARDAGVDLVVQTSTSEVYGSAIAVPMSESHPLQGQSPYSASKIASDQLAWSFWASFGLPVVILRPFNAYGPRQSLRAFIPSMINQLLAGHSKIQVGDLGTTRDLTFVKDTADAFVRTIDSPGLGGEVINVGSGFEVTMREVLASISKILGASPLISEVKERLRPEKSEVTRLFSDSSKAERLLGWTPTIQGHEGLEHGLERTVDWFMKQPRYARSADFLL